MDGLYILLGGIIFIALFFLGLSLLLEYRERHKPG